MDRERRANLTARREAMQHRIGEAEQRAALWGVDEALAAAGTPFRLWYRNDPDRPSWRAELVPAGLFHLEWDAVDTSIDEWLPGHEARASFARQAVAARTARDATLLVVPGNGLAPIIEIGGRGFAKHADLLVDLGSEMWLSGAPRWLIEFRGDRVRGVG